MDYPVIKEFSVNFRMSPDEVIDVFKENTLLSYIGENKHYKSNFEFRGSFKGMTFKLQNNSKIFLNYTNNDVPYIYGYIEGYGNSSSLTTVFKLNTATILHIVLAIIIVLLSLTLFFVYDFNIICVVVALVSILTVLVRVLGIYFSISKTKKKINNLFQGKIKY